MSHDYPACATFRGGKCSCDESDNLCPKCGSEEWDQLKDQHDRHPIYRACAICHHEWTPTTEAAEHYERTVR